MKPKITIDLGLKVELPERQGEITGEDFSTYLSKLLREIPVALADFGDINITSVETYVEIKKQEEGAK